MRKSLMLLVAVAPLAAFAGTMAPAVAESGEGSCVSLPAAAAAPAPLDLEKIPAKPIAGPRAIQGVAIDDDECDNEIVREAAGNGFRGAIDTDDDGPFEGHRVSDE